MIEIGNPLIFIRNAERYINMLGAVHNQPWLDSSYF